MLRGMRDLVIFLFIHVLPNTFQSDEGSSQPLTLPTTETNLAISKLCMGLHGDPMGQHFNRPMKQSFFICSVYFDIYVSIKPSQLTTIHFDIWTGDDFDPNHHRTF